MGVSLKPWMRYPWCFIGKVDKVPSLVEHIMAEFVTIKVLFFASAREAAGNLSSVDLELSSDSADTAALRKRLAETYPALSTMVLDEENLTLALNEEYVTAGQVIPLKAGDTVALIPPISGG